MCWVKDKKKKTGSPLRDDEESFYYPSFLTSSTIP